MTLTRSVLAALIPMLLGAAEPQERVFDLRVERVRTLRNQPGDLHIDSKGVTFRSTDRNTNITIAMRDLREVSVADARALRFQTYEVQKWKPVMRRELTLRAGPEAPVEELARFFAVRVHRPVVGHYAQGAKFQALAYHRRAFGGTNGTLEIGEESIQFVSEKPADSRTWRYSDIETIGMPDSFSFRVTTDRETYMLELKEELPEPAYHFTWSKVYNIKGKSN